MTDRYRGTKEEGLIRCTWWKERQMERKMMERKIDGKKDRWREKQMERKIDGKKDIVKMRQRLNGINVLTVLCQS